VKTLKPTLKDAKTEKLKLQRFKASAFQGLTARLAVAEETLRAIRSGEVDSVMVTGKEGSQVFTLDGAEHAYRLLIESMNEGALTLTADKAILFANQRFAKMVKCPLEHVTGSSFRRFLSAADRATLRPLMKKAAKDGHKIQVMLHAGDGSLIPVLLSIRELANEGSKNVIIGMVVTDLTEARRNEEQLRALTHRVVQAQEAERGRVALELHDHITQLLCAILVRSQTLADQLPAHEKRLKREALKLRELLGQAAEEVERISRNLRPGVLEQLGLAAVLRDTGKEFTDRTGVILTLASVSLTVRLPGNIELTLYRILQEALQNVALHARARHVKVDLTMKDDFVQLVIHDDGISFDPEHLSARRKKQVRLGLLGMHERAAYVGGILNVNSAPGKGTTVTAIIPLIDRASGGGRRSRADRLRWNQTKLI
jgi:two-component system NarL family sensor kinase